MKIPKLILSFLFASFLIWSCKEKNTKTAAQGIEKKEIKAENLQKIRFTINGMTCAVGCAKTIQEELSALEGVETATVDFEKKLATIRFDKTLQTPEDLTKAVEKVGDGDTYTVSNLKL